jgi:predicted RND superfamily exporter protein
LNFAERTVESCIDRPWLVLFAWSIAAGVLAVGAASIRVDNSPESFLPIWSDAYSDYERLRELFGGEEVVRVVFEERGEREAWDGASLLRIGELERRLASVEGMTAVVGPLSVSEARGFVGWPPEDTRRFVEWLRRSPLARGLGIVSSDGRHLSVLVAVRPGDPLAERRYLADLESEVLLASRLLSQGVDAWLAGPTVLDRALDEAAQTLHSRHLPALAAACVLLLFVVFRSWRRVALPLLFVAAAELAVVGPLGWLGVRLDLVLGVLPPLVLVIALATALHVMLRFDAHSRGARSHREAVRAAMFEKSGALVWMGVTTAAGFGSLVASRVGPVRSFGAWAAWAALTMTLAALTLFPALLATVGRSIGTGRVSRSTGGRRGIPRVLRVSVSGGSCASWAVRMRPFVLVAAALAAALALGGVARLRTETNALTYLRPEHPARVAIERTERAGLGLSSIELLFEVSPVDGRRLDDPRTLDALSRLESRLREIPDVISVAGPVGVLDTIAVGRVGADSEAARGLALVAARADPRGADAVGRFLAP